MRFLVIDLAEGFEHARKLVEEGHEVYYYTKWEASAPKFTDYVIGEGFGVQKVKSVYDVLGDVDAAVVTFVGLGSLVDLIRSAGIPVFGAGSLGERLEFDRVWSHKMMREMGIMVPKSYAANGMEDVLRFVGSNPGKYWCKVPTFRGDMDSFRIGSLEEAETVFQTIAPALGPFAGTFVLQVEEEVDGIEVGVDAFFDGNRFLEPYIFSVCGGVGSGNSINRWGDGGLWSDVLAKITPFLRDSKYCGPFGAEAFFNGGPLVVTDICARYAYTGSFINLEGIENYGDVVMSVASGRGIDPRPLGKYAACLTVESTHAMKNWVHVGEPVKGVRYSAPVLVNGVVYSVPVGNHVVATAIGVGDDYETAIDRADEILDNVHIVHGGKIPGCLDNVVLETVAELRELGVEF